jgi:outer membrane murein-binding lipoprotein Lpp
LYINTICLLSGIISNQPVDESAAVATTSTKQEVVEKDQDESKSSEISTSSKER